MICLFDMIEKQAIRRLYDMKHIQRVLSVSWMRNGDENDGKIIFYALFQDGLIRFFDLELNQHTQTYIFETKLPNNKKMTERMNNPCCKSMKSFIAMSNVMGNHKFSMHRICC